jgi:hypothetical protein
VRQLADTAEDWERASLAESMPPDPHQGCIAEKLQQALVVLSMRREEALTTKKAEVRWDFRFSDLMVCGLKSAVRAINRW